MRLYLQTDGSSGSPPVSTSPRATSYSLRSWVEKMRCRYVNAWRGSCRSAPSGCRSSLGARQLGDLVFLVAGHAAACHVWRAYDVSRRLVRRPPDPLFRIRGPRGRLIARSRRDPVIPNCPMPWLTMRCGPCTVQCVRRNTHVRQRAGSHFPHRRGRSSRLLVPSRMQVEWGGEPSSLGRSATAAPHVRLYAISGGNAGRSSLARSKPTPRRT